MLSLTVKGADDLQRVSSALRRGQGILRKEMTKAFRDAGKQTLERVKNNARTMGIRGRRKGGRQFRDHMAGTNIRSRIARVTELEVSSGGGDPRVKFIVRSERLGNAHELPAYFDSGVTFRHPIMGNRRAWAGQSGSPWFTREIEKDLDIFADKCDQAIDRTIQQIEQA